MIIQCIDIDDCPYLRKSVFMLFSLLFVCSIYAHFSYADGVHVHENSLAQSPAVFFASGQDIPVMSGLIEIETRSFSYDKPDGNITEIVALLDGVGIEQVLHYYSVTLPQFGWNRIVDIKGGHFYRSGEYFDFSFEKEGDKNLVKIMIRPSR